MSILCIVFDISIISEIHKRTGPVMNKCIHIKHVCIMITLRFPLHSSKYCIHYKQLYMILIFQKNTHILVGNSI